MRSNLQGAVEQHVARKYFQVKEKITYTDDSGVDIAIYPDDHYSIDVHIDYNSKVLGPQFASLQKVSDFKDQIAAW